MHKYNKTTVLLLGFGGGVTVGAPGGSRADPSGGVFPPRCHRRGGGARKRAFSTV